MTIPSVALPKSSPRLASGLAALLAACLLPASPAAAQPGYHCAYARQGDYGALSADFEVPRDGEMSPPAYLRWEAPRGTHPAPQISAAFYRMDDGHYRIENGFALISWHVHEPGRERRALSLQLRSRPEAPRYARGVFASDFERTGPGSIQVDWSDIAAFARGARELHVVAVDRQFRLIATTPIDRTLFARAEPHIVAALGEIETILANPAATCEYLDDLRSNDVIVTSGR